MPQRARRQAREHLGRAPHDLQPFAVLLLGCVEGRRLRLDVGVRCEGADDVGAAHAVQHREHLREVEPEALAQPPPLPLDHGTGVDERSVEIEEQRHTRIRAAFRATPKTACSTSPRSSPSACIGNGLLQVTCTPSTSWR